MKILVAVKRVVDAKIKVRPNADNTGVDASTAKMVINPFDEIAVEQAVRMKEKGFADEVVAVTIGAAKSLDTLRVALAMGADRGIHITTEESLEPLAVAKVLKVLADREHADLVLLGRQAIDDDCGQTGQMLSALMNCGLGAFATSIDVVANGLEVTRETDNGTITVEMKLPAVATASLRLSNPRYVTLPLMMKAKKKPVESIPLEATGVDAARRVRIVKVVEPKGRQAGCRVSSVDELIDKLKNEAHVI